MASNIRRPPGALAIAGIAVVAATTMTIAPTEPSRRQPNHLAREKSPYLLQHAYNPVDWYPWGKEAFEKARREGKPVFLSIGYSTCHWCHVMERESFENDSVAALLNRSFVAVKVDREERPDVDRLYMNAAQAMGLGGGWPLNLFLTPELEPFFGGTYFPPDEIFGRPGLKQVLVGIEQAWTEHRADVEKRGAAVLAVLDSLSGAESGPADRDALFDSAWSYFAHAADRERGGFGRAPKFPSTVNLNFLLRWWAHDRAGRREALDLVTRQLDAMRVGGIHDHLGGGFHRYATDGGWGVPHFEKMLYDQAQLAWCYLEGFQVTGRPEYAETARGIFTYVARDLSSPEGGFDSAEDADSEGEEGKFYVWTPAEVEGVLSKDDAALFEYRYGVTSEGNFEHGATVLHEARTVEETAAKLGLDLAATAARLESARAKLLEARGRRPRPHRDDKVLTAWNGLMISAFARGGRVLGDPALARRAERAATFLWERLRDPSSGALARRWREGEVAGEGQLDDYAYLALGFLDLYGANHDPLWLERATRLTETAVERFYDAKEGGFWESPADDPYVRVRMKEGFDGAEMAGNSIAALNLVTLGRLLDRRDWLTKAEQSLDYYARRLAGGPAAMPQMLVAMDAARTAARHIVIAGDAGDSATQALVAEFDRRFLPNDVLLLSDRATHDRLASLAPFAAALEPKAGKPTAYLCVDYACRLPTGVPSVLAAQLDESLAAAQPHSRTASRP